jgi:DNA-binding MarR family transcriptional regulator
MNQELIEQVAVRLDLAAARLLRESGYSGESGTLSAARLRTLRTIEDRGPISLADLAAAERVRAPTMSRLVDGLVREGLITRDPDPADRRSVCIAATAAGSALLRSARKRQGSALAARLRTLGDSEQRALLRGVELLERIARN